MSARKVGRWRALPALAPSKPVSRRPDRSQVKTSAQAHGQTPLPSCKPKQPAHGARWLVATAGMARTDRCPIPEVKPRTALLPAARGSRASTDPDTPPDLLNPPKGLSMAKIARVSLQLAMKSVPVADLLQSAHLPQTTPRETMIRRGYTLCEVTKDNSNLIYLRLPNGIESAMLKDNSLKQMIKSTQ